MPSVFLFTTLDTKGREADFVRDLLRSWRVAVTLVDVGALGRPAAAADVPRERIFELAETRSMRSRRDGSGRGAPWRKNAYDSDSKGQGVHSQRC